jgi:hypothetical protein
MDNELVRKHFSTHGLHMNFKGKLEITHKFATQIIDVATRKKEKKPIIMPWNPEADIRQYTGEVTNLKRMEKSAAIAPLPRGTNSPHKQHDDIKQTKMDDVVIAQSCRVNNTLQKPF